MKITISKSQWQEMGKKAGWVKEAQSQKVTVKEIPYKATPYPGIIAVIPAGTPVIPATNLPDGGYWVEPWQGMDEKAESWQRNYGFHVTEEDVR